MLGVARSVVWGACVATVQLALVLGVAIVSVNAVALTDPWSAVFAFGFSCVTIVPMFDLVEGWIGMIAGHRPARYADRAHDLGRAVVAICGSLGFVAYAVLDRSPPDPKYGLFAPDLRALAYGYAGLAVLVFGLGGAVPRVWFALRAVPGAARGEDEPALLRVAGRRGAGLSVCAFTGIWIGLFAAHLAGMRPPPPPSVYAVSPYRPTSFMGELCRVPARDCPSSRLAQVGLHHAGRARVFYGSTDAAECLATFAAPRTGALAHEQELTVGSGEDLAIQLTLPEGVPRCGYIGGISEAAASGSGGVP